MDYRGGTGVVGVESLRFCGPLRVRSILHSSFTCVRKYFVAESASSPFNDILLPTVHALGLWIRTGRSTRSHLLLASQGHQYPHSLLRNGSTIARSVSGVHSDSDPYILLKRTTFATLGVPSPADIHLLSGFNPSLFEPYRRPLYRPPPCQPY